MIQEFSVSVSDPKMLEFECDPELSAMWLLSPFVVYDGAMFHLLLRAVPDRENPKEKIARVHYGTSRDGLRFAMVPTPVLGPGSGNEDDADGCEDPTAEPLNGGFRVFYSGWSERQQRGHLLFADGPDLRSLRKGGRVRGFEPYTNPKEVTLARAADGMHVIFFEYARDGHSVIGSLRAPSLDGPWEEYAEPLVARPNSWDVFHLSTGPIICASDGTPIMLYNGADVDAHWRIGWAAFAPDLRSVIARCVEPCVSAPPPKGDCRDIAFASSAVRARDVSYLYLSYYDGESTRMNLAIP
jgi:beta-1,2-mannobiose phosphorylase / 1,2-beta-oligomannan phosphorylase